MAGFVEGAEGDLAFFESHSLTHWHVQRLTEAQLVLDPRIFSRNLVKLTELGIRFLDFVDASPEVLLEKPHAP